MIKSKELEKIKETIISFFEKADFLIEIDDLFIKEKTVFLKLKNKEPKILIGKNGNTLNSIQHLLRIIIRRSFLEDFFLDVDINNYKERKIEYLKEIAQEAADKVAFTKKEEILEQMSAYERRIIHIELSKWPNITTESIGKEPERRVVVKPKP